jgi:hypothetical protein
MGEGRERRGARWGHASNGFREPIGFVDILAFLTLASAVGVTLTAAVIAVAGLLS